LPGLLPEDREKLNQIHKVVILLINKSREFIQWARSHDRQNPIEAVHHPVPIILKVLFNKTPSPSLSPFMEPDPVLKAENIKFE
jgi:hypothetical protein